MMFIAVYLVLAYSMYYKYPHKSFYEKVFCTDLHERRTRLLKSSWEEPQVSGKLVARPAIFYIFTIDPLA